MKIALYTSNRTTIPPEKDIVSATANLTSFLADGLVEIGHDVTLYAAKGSKSKSKIIDLDLPPPRLDFSLTPEEWVKNMNLGMKQIYLGELFKRADEYDIIHLQTEPVYLGMPFAKMVGTPTVITNHNVFIPQEKAIFDYYIKQPLVSISNSQRSIFPYLNYIATVYDGLTFDIYPFYEKNDESDYMFFMGRLVPVKGVREVIEVAQRLEKKLIIAGKGTDKFINEVISPHISEKIIFTGMLDYETNEWFDAYGKAKLLVAPIQWDEPFGMVSIEAMACGTPVIAFARGAFTEVIKDGETGYLVKPSDQSDGDYIVKKSGIDGICEAVERLYSLSKSSYQNMRFQAREHVKNNFTIEKMVKNYENVYKQLIIKSK